MEPTIKPEQPTATRLPNEDILEAEERALEQFGQWFDAECEKLVQQWIHLAAPNAQRLDLGRGRGR
ncbi:MAG TPA: hypothetical protein VG713_01020 [Pirellulales bacterium]|nr:hypothetical protein [Pirellulales bacterium]